MRRLLLCLPFACALVWAQWSQSLSARLEVNTGQPSRVYLFKNDRPFRLSPVDAVLPLRADTFYRERIFQRPGTGPRNVLEVICNDVSHFFLLKGAGRFDLPAGKYRIEAYRGHFAKPVIEEFELKAGETRKLSLKLENWAGADAHAYVSADDHVHLVRDREDDATFLSWLDAEDLSVGNFLQLQRQSDAAWQYGFGPAAEAKRPGRSIRSGHESRSEFFGHIAILGGREMLRPLSLGTMYSNGPDTTHHPHMLFQAGKKVGALTGFAHFHGSMPHSSMLMNLALGDLDFLELFQFGKLWTSEWYELLNAGFKVTGVAGSDFPVALARWTTEKAWNRWLPLLGPERLAVPVRPGMTAYESWAEGVRRGEGFVTNGPIVKLRVEGGVAKAEARFWRPLARIEIVVNGQVTSGTEARLPETGPVWVAARAAAPADPPGTPEIQAHTNPVYIRWDGKAPAPAARRRLAEKWAAELEWYRTAPLVFATPEAREQFFSLGNRALTRFRE
ncbi:MAG: CehA/McbA family metallohydrolase [Bryobacterales bacterium]|nr:CehA/McbA family metallohydrolase [Bryobacterales bacterium]